MKIEKIARDALNTAHSRIENIYRELEFYQRAPLRKIIRDRMNNWLTELLT